MAKRLLHESEIRLGEALPADAVDRKGVLLLCAGYVIESPWQIQMLLENAVLDRGRQPIYPEAFTPGRESPLGLVLSARQFLKVLLTAPPAHGFADEIINVVGMLARACKLNTDVALATVLLRPEGSYAVRQSVNVAIACHVVGSALKMEPAELVTTVAAALTMNIAMLELQDVLSAQAEPLSEEQREAVRSHCERGVARLRELGVEDELWLDAVLDHHEHEDGGGYPGGKTGAEVSRAAKLLALADIYCARVSSRETRQAMSPNVALRWLFLGEGTVVDEYLAALFIKTLGIYPPGTGVKLRNGSIAIVTQRGATGHMPRVASITTSDGLRLAKPLRRESTEGPYAIAEVVNLDALQLEPRMEQLWGADGAA